MKEFHYRSSFNGTSLPEAYERLLLEAIQGDASLFTCSDGIESSWQVIDPVLEGWARQNISTLVTYKRGAWGLAEADELLARAGHTWRLGCVD